MAEGQPITLKKCAAVIQVSDETLRAPWFKKQQEYIRKVAAYDQVQRERAALLSLGIDPDG